MKNSISPSFAGSCDVTTGLVALAYVNPYENRGPSLCLLHYFGFNRLPRMRSRAFYFILIAWRLEGLMDAHPLGSSP
jgi:hypothetical protein